MVSNTSQNIRMLVCTIAWAGHNTQHLKEAISGGQTREGNAVIKHQPTRTSFSLSPLHLEMMVDACGIDVGPIVKY